MFSTKDRKLSIKPEEEDIGRDERDEAVDDVAGVVTGTEDAVT